MTGSRFCPCTDYTCKFNPQNHDQGCDLCVEDSVNCREIPKCFFLKVNEDISGITDWSFEAFADFVIKNGKEDKG